MTNSPHNNFKQRLLNGDFLVGTFQKTPSMMISEVLGSSELDTVCIDAEHSPFDRTHIDACLMAYRAARMPALVRVASGTPAHILNVSDCGATGVVVPHVDSPEKAQAIANAARFGDGGRGYAGSTRAAAYGGNSVTENLANNNNDTTVIAQIEDLKALECLDEIASVDGIDCLFIGTMDLTVALGANNANDPKVIATLETICAAAAKHNRRTGIFVPNLQDVPIWQKHGVSLFLLGSEHGFIKQGVSDLLSKIQ